MKTRAAIAVVVLIVVVMTVVSVVRHRRAALVSSMSAATSATVGAGRTRAADSDNSAMPSEMPAAALPATPLRDLIARDSDAAARQWQRRAERVMLAKDRKEYGADAARLMRLNPDQAWRELSERAEAGDLQAAAAAGRIAALCMPPLNTPDAAPPPVSLSSYLGLPQNWKSFVERLDAIQKDIRRERVSHCGGVGKPLDVAETLLDRFFRPDNLEAQVEVAGDNANDAEAITDLRKLVTETGLLRAKFALGDRLLESHNTAEQTEGRALLEAIAADDPLIAARLGYCLHSGCGGFPPDPGSAKPWLEQAAGLGETFGLMYLKMDLDEKGDKVAAWSWSLYVLDLAISGCFETISPSYREIAAAAQDEARRKALLSAAEQNAGLAISYAIFGRFERQAKERLSCAD